MRRPQLELADIFGQYGPEYRKKHRLTRQRWRAMRAIELCRTAALGGHVNQCDSCGYQSISYNSCRNRHCPKCQSLARAHWVQERLSELLPVPYFHVVFTLPDYIAGLAMQNRKVVYNLLFRAASETLRTIAADPKHLGAQIGFLAILHTWGQTLLHHPHIHCVVPGGGLSPDRCRWVHGRGKKFFLPVRVLSRMFRGKFIAYLKQAYEEGKLNFKGNLEQLADPQAFKSFLQNAYRSNWVVYAKPPFGGPAQVLDYLGRYTHRVAISNNRLLQLKDGRVTFRWKNYRHGNRPETMTLEVDEFIRRFLLHILPNRFMRIRHFGFLANRNRDQNLALCRQLLNVPQPAELAKQDWQTRYEALTGQSLLLCPSCKHGQLRLAEILLPVPPSCPLQPGIDSS
jgi:putative transposase/transposase-like zinc-binding protein